MKTIEGSSYFANLPDELTFFDNGTCNNRNGGISQYAYANPPDSGKQNETPEQELKTAICFMGVSGHS